MSDPFSLLPLSLAAHEGRVDDFEIQRLVAAGLNLLQRSATLVRALSGKRSAILLPTTPEFFVALAASEGRGAVLINPLASAGEIAYQIADANVGAVFTNAALGANLPADFPRVLLDAAPRSASVVANGIGRDVDLGSHLGLPIEGEHDAAGSDDEAVIVYTPPVTGPPLGAILSHRNLLASARSTREACAITSGDTVLALAPVSHSFGLTAAVNAPLLASARVLTMPRFDPERAVELLGAGGITVLVGVPTVFRALLETIDVRGQRRVGGLRLCVSAGTPPDVTLQQQWLDASGVELRQGYGLNEAPLCLFNGVDHANVRGTLGRPVGDVEVRVVDGEICVRGDPVFRGYVSHPEAGRKVVDGWLHTGDAGILNADGTVTLRPCPDNSKLARRPRA